MPNMEAKTVAQLLVEEVHCKTFCPFSIVITDYYKCLFPPLVSGNSQRMSVAMRSIGNPVSTICIGALFNSEVNVGSI
jgi:hypothetical protein